MKPKIQQTHEYTHEARFNKLRRQKYLERIDLIIDQVARSKREYIDFREWVRCGCLDDLKEIIHRHEVEHNELMVRNYIKTLKIWD